ncbi:amino acid permease-domain-containing protein [Clohesyomyces aquaticus]|uniref:Amino acid permease-domain-containing protein n=1 Tax=Clohesyomyces aquaticus TaxID=1231657 RepID=A0A1Y1Z936_9PLEO|nr:amino acid permease-domain-containing protein [Clohesyomyces aquaticus]
MMSTTREKQGRLSPPQHHRSANATQRRRVNEESISRTTSITPSSNSSSGGEHQGHVEVETRVRTASVAAHSSMSPSEEVVLAGANGIMTAQRSGEGYVSDKNERREQAAQGQLNHRINSDPSSSTSRTSPPRHDSDNWTESGEEVPRRNLTELDVAALILNKMIGTGIFTMPGTVLLYTKSKTLSMALWTVGGVWTCLFLVVYLEFGSAFPFNGGELIYLDEIYYKPELLATILFSGWFLVLGNSYGNSIAFAKHVMVSAHTEVLQTKDLDSRLVRFIAISVLTVVCLLHYFSGRAGMFLNKVLFWYKTLLLIVIFAAGIHYTKTNGSQWDNYNDLKERGTSLDSLAAMVSIFYAYQGWENANYVTGEIRALEGRTPARTLKIGAFIAVFLVWILYILVTLAYYTVLDYDTITDNHSDLGLVLHFAPKVFGNTRALKICIALSAFGNILAVTYTSSKVKQSISNQRIIPFHRFFSRDSDTPKGALALHWVSSVILICICPTSSDGFSFATGLFTYGHLIVSIFVTVGLFWLKGRVREVLPNYRLTFFRSKWIIWPVAIIFTLGNLLVVVNSARSETRGKIPRYWWPATFGFILLGSFFYWGAMMLMTVKVKSKRSDKKEETIGSRIGFEVKIYKADEGPPEATSEEMEDSIRVSRQDGSKRRVGYEFSGFFALCERGCTKVKKFLAKYMF